MSTIDFRNGREVTVRQADLNGQPGGELKNSLPVESPGLRVRSSLKAGEYTNRNTDFTEKFWP